MSLALEALVITAEFLAVLAGVALVLYLAGRLFERWPWLVTVVMVVGGVYAVAYLLLRAARYG